MAKRYSRRSKGKNSFRRRKPTRIERDRVLIVTEGEKTEPDYFKLLISELGLTTAKVKIAGEGGSAPVSVFDTTERILNQDDDFEQIYLVFDRDRHASYDDAIAKTTGLGRRAGFEKKTIRAVTSVPCFEVWYSLHLTDTCKPYGNRATGSSPAKAMISDLKKTKLNGTKLFQGYEKSGCRDFYELITPQRPDAQLRAAGILKQATARGDPLHHEDPSTRVHLLVDALEKLSKN
jgi:RloB-like protein